MNAWPQTGLALIVHHNRKGKVLRGLRAHQGHRAAAEPGPGHARAVLEGVAFGLRDSMELMRSAGLGEIKQVCVSGGGAKSSLWLQILADVLGTELVTVKVSEGAAYGATLLAGVGAGTWPTVEAACQAAVRSIACISPQSETRAI